MHPIPQLPAKAPASPSPVKALEKDFKVAISPMHSIIARVNHCESSFKEKVAEAQSTARRNGKEIEQYLSTSALPLASTLASLSEANANAYALEREITECDEEMGGELKKVVEAITTLVVQRQQTNMQIFKHHCDVRLQTMQQGTPLQLKLFAQRVEHLKKELDRYPAELSQGNVEERFLQTWTKEQADLKAQQEKLWQKEPNAVLKCMDDLKGFVERKVVLDAGKFPMITDAIPLAIVEEHAAIWQQYRDKYKTLKETSAKFWNDSLLDGIVVDIKLSLIKDNKKLGVSLPMLEAKLTQLEKDLKEARHKFKPKGAQGPDKSLVGNHEHLNKEFQNLIPIFSNLLADWKKVRSSCEPVIKEYEAKLKKLSEVEAQGIATEDHPKEAFQASLKLLLEVDVPGWVSPFQNAPVTIKKLLDEIALWMDMTSAVLANPDWATFPKRITFVQNIGYRYSTYTFYRNQVKE